jgi:hypothetical protein
VRIAIVRGSCFAVAASFSLAGAALLAQEPAKENHRPTARSGHALVFDAKSSRVLLIGGDHESDATTQDELWAFDGRGWTRVGEAPPPLALSAVAWDAARARLVVQGGNSGPGASSAATRLFDGAKWSTLEGPGPGARDHHAGAYDEARERFVLFGGQPTPGKQHGDTWEFDGATWCQVGVGASTMPAPRIHHAMAYDAALEKVILFGGCDAKREFGDTWEWNGTAWRLAAAESADGPSPRTGARMAFDSGRERVVLFGGSAREACGDTWTWEGDAWKRVDFPAGAKTPPARSHHAMAGDTARGKVILFGGFDGSINLDDTWELDASGWHELAARR